MIVLHYGSFASRFCQHGFRSLLAPRRAFHPRGRRQPVERGRRQAREHGDKPAPAPATRSPKPSDPQTRNLWRMGLFTGVGVGGAFVGLTELEAMDLRDRMLPRSNESQSWLRRVRQAMPTLTIDGVFYGIVGACIVIFLGWQVRAMQPFMLRYFVSTPLSKTPVLCLILSSYSHSHWAHLAANMFCFTSFYEPLKHQFSPKHLVFFCWSAGLLSGFGGALINAVMRRGINSIGFSGVTLAAFGYICSWWPDTRFSILFFGSFRGDQILPCVVLFDLFGLFIKGSWFDHAAHLCGVGFGVFYQKWGQRLYARRVLHRSGGKI